MKGMFVMLTCMLTGIQSYAVNRMDFPMPYASFHIVKGNTHNEYPCTDIDDCYKVFKAAQLARKIQCSDSFWMERTDGTIERIK